MTDYHWNDLYVRATDLFHEPPGQQLENEIVQVFKTNPARVKNEIERLGAQILAGAEIRSAWAILRKRLQATPDDITATDKGNAEQAILNARRWLHNAGCYLDLERDVEDELFGQQGILHQHDTEQLRAEMLDAWRQERPRGERAEEAHEAYMAKIVADRKRIEQAKTTALEVDDDPEPGTPEWRARQAAA